MSLYSVAPSEVFFVGCAMAVTLRPLEKKASHTPLSNGVGGASPLPLFFAGAFALPSCVPCCPVRCH
eukprot:5981915-Lingulodinium_polyedra.AAC.1